MQTSNTFLRRNAVSSFSHSHTRRIVPYSFLSSCATNVLSRHGAFTNACKNDLSLQNPVVTQAYNGLIAYDTLYAASCLTSSTTGNYCYADAVANSSAPTSSYIYYLPLGHVTTRRRATACTECLKDTMSIFVAAADHKQSNFRNNYAQAAQVVDLTCGPSFVEAGVAYSGAAKLGDVSNLLMD